MRILIIPQILPYPVHSGYALRVQNIAKRLAQSDDVTIVARSPYPIDSRALSECYGPNVHFEAVTIPRPTLGAKIVKGAGGLAGRYPVMASGMYFPEIRRILERLAASTRFDVVQIDGHFGARYFEDGLFADALRVVVQHNVESELLNRQADVMRAGPARWLKSIDAVRMGAWERDTLSWAKTVVAVSARDAEMFRRIDPRVDVIMAPNGVDCDRCERLPPAAGSELLFVGALDYFPNVHGLSHFVTKVLPRVRDRVTDASLTIVGRNPVPEVRSLGRAPGVRLVGEVDDVKSFYANAAVVVVPLYSGGGTRLKILEAFAYGRAVVSTCVGHEGIPGVEDVLVSAADDDAMVQGLAELLRSPVARSLLTSAAREFVEARFDWGRVAIALRSAYASRVAAFGDAGEGRQVAVRA